MSKAGPAPLLGVSLLHISRTQAAAAVSLTERFPGGLLIRAGWQQRLPVIEDIRPAESLKITGCSKDLTSDRFMLARCGSPQDAQKHLKAFGNRLAAHARKPLRFERVRGRGLIHLAPSYHHLGACGIQLDAEAVMAPATCPNCILLALTPLPVDRRSDFHPFGHVYIADLELKHLRNHACRGVESVPPV